MAPPWILALVLALLLTAFVLFNGGRILARKGQLDGISRFFTGHRWAVLLLLVFGVGSLLALGVAALWGYRFSGG
jgi:predicted membrane protein